MSNISLLTPEATLTEFKKFRVGQIDGAKTSTSKAFYQAIEKTLSFPNDFEHNLESLDEFLNDLSWIKQVDVALYITNSEVFLSEEKPAKVLELLNLLDATAEDWKWVDEEDGVGQKNFKILIQYSLKIANLLEKDEIPFGML